MNKPMMKKIQEYRKKLEKMPNGWPLCAMIGSDYQQMTPKRKKRQQMI
jgi:hypothetical protein